MRKLLLFFVAVLCAFIWLNGEDQICSGKENAIRLGTVKLGVKIHIFSDHKTESNEANVDSLLNSIDLYAATVSVFAKNLDDQVQLLNRNRDMFYGEIPVERLQEIGNVRWSVNGVLQGGTLLVFRQEEPVWIKIYMSEDGTLFSVDYQELDMQKWANVSCILSGSVTVNPFMFVPKNKDLYNESWKAVRSYQIDSIWPQYQKEALGKYSIPEEVSDWLMNDLKIAFASYCILPYVKNADELAGLKVDEPPMEAYTFLDSIDYSPDVFLKTNTLMSIGWLLQSILDYAGGGFERIGETPVAQWEEMADRKLEPAMKERPKLLLDLLAGMSYVLQIEDGEPLTEIQKKNISDGFTDDIGKIVLAKNDRSLAMRNDKASLQDLIGEEFTLQEYIDRNYAGKPVVVDLWNTWCAPCLSAISQTEDIKHSFAGPDLVFLYVSNESSPAEAWKKQAAKIGGDQVRISMDASDALLAKYGFTGFPSYLFFDRSHKLVHAQTAFPGLKRYGELLDEIAK